MSSRWRAPALLFATAATATLLLAACGGDQSLEREAYAEQANRFCEDANAAQSELDRPSGADPEEIADFLRRTTPIGERLRDRIDGLEPADEISEQAQALVDALDANLERTKRLQSAAADQDSDAFADEQRAAIGDATRLTQAADEVGITQCGQGDEDNPTGGTAPPPEIRGETVPELDLENQ